MGKKLQSGKSVVTPLDDTTLTDSHKKGGKFHASLLADTQCATVWRLESFFSTLFCIFSRLVNFFFADSILCLPLFVDHRK